MDLTPEAEAIPKLDRRPTANRRFFRSFDTAVVIFACTLFLGLALNQLELPGLYNDEAFDVIPAMQIVTGQPVEVLRDAAVAVFGVQLPLMSSSDYQGATSTYLAIPFFLLGGVSVFSLRLMTVTVGVIGIILTYFLARAWFGRSEALLACLLMATSPAWIFWSRLGVYVVSEVVPISTGALFALTRWVRTRPLGSRNFPLYAGLFLLGLGLATKLLYLWMLVAIGVIALMFCARPVYIAVRQKPPVLRKWVPILAASLLAFCLGALPFLLYNLLTRGTIHLLRGSASNLTSTTHGVNNTAFVRNLWTEVDGLKILLDGGYFWFQGVLARTYSNPLTPALFAISALGLCAFILVRRQTDVRPGGLTIAGALLSGLSLLLSTAIVVKSEVAGLLIPAIATGIAGTGLLLWQSVRTANSQTARRVLLGFCCGEGTIWWFGGAGRPEGPSPGTPLGLWGVDAAGILFWLTAFCVVVILALDTSPRPNQRAVTALLTIVGLVVAQSSVTLSGLWSTHLLILLPLPQIAVAAFAVRAGRWLKTHWITGPVASILVPAALIGSVATADLYVDALYHGDLAITGGSSTFSDAIYGLTNYLETQVPKRKIVAMDWGFRRPIQLLSVGEVDPLDAFDGTSRDPTPKFYADLDALLSDSSNLYLFHLPYETAFPRYYEFKDYVRRLHRTPVLERTFTLRTGVPVYEVYSVK